MNNAKILVTILSAVIIFFITSCTRNNQDSDNINGLPSSGGKTLEMIVVASDSLYNGQLRDSIMSNFAANQRGLNQSEPMFDVVHLRESHFIHSDMLQKHRNILIIDYKKGNPNKMYQEINRRVYPQSVYKLMVDNRDSLFAILMRFYPTIKYQFYKNEHIRIYNAFKRDENIKLTDKIDKVFNLHLTIPADYYLAKEKKDFFWIRKETENESYDIMLYKAPFSGNGLFNQEKIIEIRDQIAKENIPGPTRGSYMGTEKRVEIYSDTINIKNNAVVETRGLWRLFGDFMGGAFINYVFQNPNTKEYVMIDCFLYSPKKPKRDLLMQMESIVYSIDFNKNKKNNNK